jgi:RHS repeat-associated protein
MRTERLLWLVMAAWLALASPGSYASTTTYYHNDLAGSPVAASNESGQVLWRESYRPYGERLTNSAASTDNKVYFTSRRQDAETGLVYMGARYYDPMIGRFISTDPKQFDEKNAQLFNRYAYANNNPYKYVDPDGRDAIVVVNGDRSINILVPIQFSGAASSPALIANIKEDVHKAWSGTYGGIDVDVRVIDGSMNKVDLIQGATSCDGGRSCVIGGNTGVWDVSAPYWSDGVAAHEVGHLMGHGDKYDPVPGTPFTAPKDGWNGNLMGELGVRADSRNLREIIGSPNNSWVNTKDSNN